MPRVAHMLSPFPAEPELNPFAGVDFNELEKSLRRPRTLMNVLLSGLVTVHDPPGARPACFP